MKELHFDPLDIELGDIDILEKLTGKPFEQFSLTGVSGVGEMKALYYIVMRQNQPDFHPNQLDKVKIRELVDVAEAVKTATPDPIKGEGEV